MWTNLLDIEGLRFLPNQVRESAARDRTQVLTDAEYVVGHFVTHAPAFRYGDAIGLHLGQVDQLTFVSTEPKVLVGTFLDCRAGSATFGRRVSVPFASSLARRLVIPAGVAHTFENIGGVVTRNDLRLYCSATNPQWRLEDDLISLPLDIERDAIEPVEPNTLPLPREAAILFYQLQRELLRGGRDRSAAQVTLPVMGLGVCCEPNSMFPVAASSWGLIASTPSCVTELWVVHAFDPSATYTLHEAHDTLHTFLDRTGAEIRLEVVDRRVGASASTSSSFRFACDERFHVRIPAGVAYRYAAEGAFVVREEAA